MGSCQWISLAIDTVQQNATCSREDVHTGSIVQTARRKCYGGIVREINASGVLEPIKNDPNGKWASHTNQAASEHEAESDDQEKISSCETCYFLVKEGIKLGKNLLNSRSRYTSPLCALLHE